MSRLFAALCFLSMPTSTGVAAETRPAHGAKFIGMSAVPEKLLTGQVFYVQITMENTGTSGWGPENEKHVILRSQEPADNETWGTFFITQGQGTDVPSGEQFTFHSWLMAPLASGEHVLRWRLGKIEGEGYAGRVTLFGEATPRRVIAVERRPEAPASPATSPPASAPAPAAHASGKRVLRFEDFDYAGSFKVPDRKGHDLPFSHSGLALRRMQDGSRRVFFNYTHPQQALVELEIPPLVKLDEKNGIEALKVAAVKHVWGKLEIEVPKEKLSNARESIFANGGYCWDEARKTLYWTWWDSYWCGDPPPLLAATRLQDDGSMKHLGVWAVRPGMYKWYWGGVLRLPPRFAAQYGGGRTLGLGFGTGYSGTYSGSLGPSLSLIREPDPSRDWVEATHALGYYGGDSAPRDGRYFIATNDATGGGWMGCQPESPENGSCGSGDLVRSGLFIETPGKHAFIAFVNLQLGRIGYDYGSGYPPRRTNCWYFYDPDELGAAARGEKKIAVAPCSRTDVPEPGGQDLRPSLADPITGSCYDETESLLYVYTFLTSRGCIHAYRLKGGGVSAARWSPLAELGGPGSIGSPGGTHPIAAAGDAVTIVWTRGTDLYSRRSADRGRTWGDAVRITEHGTAQYPCSLELSGKFLHLIWPDSRSGSWEVYYKRSADGGGTWGPERRLTPGVDLFRLGTAVSGSTLHVVWGSRRLAVPTPGGTHTWGEIYYMRTTDGGETWEPPVRLTQPESSAMRPSVAASGRYVHVTWFDRRDSTREWDWEVYTKRSTDGGASWGDDVRMSRTPTHTRHPEIIAAPGGIVCSIWEDGQVFDGKRWLGDPALYASVSEDDGAGWGEPRRITAINAPDGWATHAKACASGSVVHLAWTDAPDGQDRPRAAFYMSSRDGGITWGTPERLTFASDGECWVEAVGGTEAYAVVLVRRGNQLCWCRSDLETGAR